MVESRVGNLKVPGATLHYEVTGDGPTLLLIPGGPADSGAFVHTKGELSDHYTVITYDPRGLSRSPFDSEPEDTSVKTFAEDAHELLALHGEEPAYVFANSGGALVGLELLSRYPEQIRSLVAHEPPLVHLLEDAEEHEEFGKEIHDTYLAEGVGPAIKKFLTSNGLDQEASQPPADPSPEMVEAMAQMQRNLDFFFGHMYLALGEYRPDLSRLSTLPVTVAVGEDSEGQTAYRGGVALAQQLSKELVVFPGEHGGFDTHSEKFAARLKEVWNG